MARTKLPINRSTTLQGRCVDVLLESGKTLSFTLPAGVLVRDKLEQLGIEENFIEVPTGLGQLQL